VGERARQSAALCERLSALPVLKDAAVVLAYWPLVGRGEIDLRPLLAVWRSEGKTVLLPRVTSAPGAAPAMEAAAFEGEGALAAGRFGVPEPTGPAAPLGSIGAVLLPGLAADVRGYRLGYGGGFYDAFLARLRSSLSGSLHPAPPTALALYDGFVLPALPAEPHDVPVRFVVTPSQSMPSQSAHAKR
jgi:5-formyltetrahydrofolate cyclo-ligase